MSNQGRRSLIRGSSAAVALSTLGTFAGRAGAQGTQPLENVKIVTGFPPGGTTDTLWRRVAEDLRAAATPSTPSSRTSRAPAARSPCRR